MYLSFVILWTNEDDTFQFPNLFPIEVQQGVYKLLVNSKFQLADFFTMSLPTKSFHSFISKLNMLNIYHVQL